MLYRDIHGDTSAIRWLLLRRLAFTADSLRTAITSPGSSYHVRRSRCAWSISWSTPGVISSRFVTYVANLSFGIGVLSCLLRERSRLLALCVMMERYGHMQ